MVGKDGKWFTRDLMVGSFHGRETAVVGPEERHQGQAETLHGGPARIVGECLL